MVLRSATRVKPRTRGRGSLDWKENDKVCIDGKVAARKTNNLIIEEPERPEYGLHVSTTANSFFLEPTWETTQRIDPVRPFVMRDFIV